MPSPIGVAALPKWVVGDMSDLPPIATEERTSRDFSNVPNGLVHRSADSDDLARVYRFDLAQDSEMISPTIPI
jgi:hypothetical protein